MNRKEVAMWGSRLLLIALLCIVGILIWPSPTRPSSAEIRLDTGDLRLTCCAAKVLWERTMNEPDRKALLSVSSRSPVLKNEWHRCARFPLPSSNNTDQMCRRFYRCAATWVRVDPAIGLLVAEDVARYVERTKAEESLPDCISLLNWVGYDSNGGMIVADGWQQDERVVGLPRYHGIAR
ncbi:MAG: hypothetical protein U0992_00765 [Planctomycetaceae bacterium]